MFTAVGNIAQRRVDIAEQMAKLQEEEMKAETGDEKYALLQRQMQLTNEDRALSERQGELQSRAEAFSTPYKDQVTLPATSSSSSSGFIPPPEGKSNRWPLWQRLMFFFILLFFVRSGFGRNFE